MLAELNRTGEDQISLTDPDSRAMAAHTHVAVGYNAQVAVDTKHKLIVEQQVTNQVVDMGLLTQTAEPAKAVLGVETIAAVADKGYFKIEDIGACERVGIVPYVPRPQRGPSARAGLFRKNEFGYDAAADQHDVALMRQELAASQVAHQGLVDWRAIKGEVVDVLGQRQLGNRDLVADGPRLVSPTALQTLYRGFQEDRVVGRCRYIKS